jgi:hypothetical protein
MSSFLIEAAKGIKVLGAQLGWGGLERPVLPQ